MKVNPAGTDFAYATFLGGGDSDVGSSITVDETGAAYITGTTSSKDFPTTVGALNTTYGGYYNAFVVKMDPPGSALAYATFLGGSDGVFGKGIAVDTVGAAYVTGDTTTGGAPFHDLPTTAGVFAPIYNGGYSDAFVVKINPTGTNFVYSSFLGGSDDDRGRSIAVDRTGAAYVVGISASRDFPTTDRAFDTTYNGNYDVFTVST